MVIIGILLIVAVALDAWRRIRSERYSRVKVKLAEAEAEGGVDEEPLDDISMFKELPNGGARVVERDDLLRAAQQVARSRVEEESPALKPTRRPIDDPPKETPIEPELPVPDPIAETTASAADAASEDVATEGHDDDDLMEGISAAEESETLDWLETIPVKEPAEDKGGEQTQTAPVQTRSGEPDMPRLPRDIEPEVFRSVDDLYKGFFASDAA